MRALKEINNLQKPLQLRYSLVRTQPALNNGLGGAGLINGLSLSLIKNITPVDPKAARISFLQNIPNPRCRT